MQLHRFSVGVATALLTGMLGTSSSLGAQAPARRLEMSFSAGNVTIRAENVTLRDIMIEWSRTGGSRMVNADRLGGGPLPYVEFDNQPETLVLRSLLRDIPGYGAAPRLAPEPGTSAFASVFLLPSRTVPVSAAPGPATPSGQAPPPVEDSADDERVRMRVDGSDDPTERMPTSSADPSSNLRVGPGGLVTSTVPGVIIPGRLEPVVPPPAGRGRGGGQP